MKKKYRDIEVDGVQYAWIARENGSVTIWKDKKPIYEDIVFAGSVPVVPPMIATVITMLQKNPKVPQSKRGQTSTGLIHTLTEAAYYEQEAKDLHKRYLEAKRLEREALNKLFV